MDGHKVYEYGEFVENGERSDLNDITQMIESGATDRDIQLAYPSQFLDTIVIRRKAIDVCITVIIHNVTHFVFSVEP